MPYTAELYWPDTDVGDGANNKRLDVDEPTNGNMGGSDFGTSTTVRWILHTPDGVNHTTPNQTADPGSADGKNIGFNIRDADMQQVGHRRFIKAGTWDFTIRINAGVADVTNNVYRVGANVFKRTSGGTLTHLFFAQSATFAPALGPRTVTFTGSGPDVEFTDDETLQVEIWIKGKGLAITGQIIEVFRGTSLSESTTVDLPAPGIRTIWLKTISGAATPAGALIRNARLQLTGAITPAGDIVRLPKMLRTGAVAPTGAILKRSTQTLSGSIGPAGALLKRPQLTSLAGVVASAGSVIRTTRKVLTGEVTPSGSLSVFARRFFDGAVTPAGAVLKKATKSLSGTITPTGEAVPVFIAVRLFTGGLTSAGEVVRNVAKFVSGAITPAGEATVQLFKVTAGTITPSGSLTKTTKKLFEAAMGPFGGAIEIVRKIFPVFDD